MVFVGIILFVLTFLWALAHALGEELKPAKDQLTWFIGIILFLMLVIGIFIKVNGG